MGREEEGRRRPSLGAAKGEEVPSQHPGILKGPPQTPLPSPSCLTGYVNHSLSVFFTKDFQDPVQTEGENVTECRSGPPAP